MKRLIVIVVFFTFGISINLKSAESMNIDTNIVTINLQDNQTSEQFEKTFYSEIQSKLIEIITINRRTRSINIETTMTINQAIKFFYNYGYSCSQYDITKAKRKLT